MQTPLGDRLYRTVTTVCAAAIPLVLVLLTAVVLRAAWPALSTHAADLAFGTTWDVPRARFGALPAIAGTLLTALLALGIATPLALGVAIFTVDIGPRRLHEPVEIGRASCRERVCLYV